LVHSEHTGQPPPKLVHHNQTVYTAGSSGTYSSRSQSDEKFKFPQGEIHSVNKIGNSEIYRLNHTSEKLVHVNVQEESQFAEIPGSSGFCELSHSGELTNQVHPEMDHFKVTEVSLYDENNKTRAVNLVLKITINGEPVEALIDTAAQVTVINEKFANTLEIPLKIGHRVSLKGAGNDTSIRARYADKVVINIGQTETRWRIIVADISDPVIIGLDLLKHLKAIIDLVDFNIIIKGEKIPAYIMKSKEEDVKICRVELDKQVVVPPKSSLQMRANLKGECNKTIMIQPSDNLKGLLMPNIITIANSTVPISLKNPSNKHITLKKNCYIGTALEIKEVIENDEEVSLKARAISTNTPKTENMDNVCSKVPNYLKELLKKSKQHLDAEQTIELARLLIEFQDIFSKNDLDLGHFTKIKHRIDTGDAPPVKERMRRTPLGFEKEEEKHIKELLEKNIIQPSSSEWAAAPVLVRKRDGKLRYCIDYRKLNAVTKKDAFPLPRIETCLDTLQGTIYMSCLDMASGYYQAEICEEDRHKTAFVTKYGLFEHFRLSFGLCNSPGFFQRMIQLILTGLTWKECLAYLDDVIVLGKDFKDHLNNLKKVLQRFKDNNLKLKPSKC